MADLLLTNGVYREQFPRLPRDLAVLDLDQPASLRLTADRLVVAQGQSEVVLHPGDRAVFLPFRSPFEPSDTPTTRQTIAAFVRLLASLNNLGVAIANAPARWFAAYDKSILLTLADLVSVPPFELHAGVRRIVPPGPGYLLKSGLGIKKGHRGQYLSAAVLDEAPVTGLPADQTYMVQRYVEANREARLYVFRTSGVLAFEMPIGTPDEPDWRDSLSTRRLRVTPLDDPGLSDLGTRILDRLGLDYVCLDLIEAAATWHLIDVNPHGSWSWLPKSAAQVVRRAAIEWTSS